MHFDPGHERAAQLIAAELDNALVAADLGWSLKYLMKLLATRKFKQRVYVHILAQQSQWEAQQISAARARGKLPPIPPDPRDYDEDEDDDSTASP